MLSGHPLRGVWYRPPAGTPDLVRTISTPPDGVGTPRSREVDFEAAPDEGVGTPDFVRTIYGGKLRCTGATWTDAVIIFPDEVLAFQNIERQARALRAPAPGGVVQTPRRHPRSR